MNSLEFPLPGSKAYVSGPMTGLPELNHPAFHAAAKQLRLEGYEVVNPVEIDEAEAKGQESLGRFAWGHYLSRDISMILLGDFQAIVLLAGWLQSMGSRLEAYAALCVGVPLFEYETRKIVLLKPTWQLPTVTQ
tara:strand:- start:177 stop:578 length:402 start_codon:yes stop_codon:yes gene_type:complete